MLGAMIVRIDETETAYLVRHIRDDGAMMIVTPEGQPHYVPAEDCTVVGSYLPPDVRVWWDGMARHEH